MVKTQTFKGQVVFTTRNSKVKSQLYIQLVHIVDRSKVKSQRSKVNYNIQLVRIIDESKVKGQLYIQLVHIIDRSKVKSQRSKIHYNIQLVRIID